MVVSLTKTENAKVKTKSDEKTDLDLKCLKTV